MMLIINQKKQSVHEIEEHTYTNAYSEEYYIPSETLETKNEGDVDIDGLNAEHGRHNFKLIETIIERINVKIEYPCIRMLKNRRNNKEFKFPLILELFESESDLVNYNMFPKDYDECNVAKTLI